MTEKNIYYIIVLDKGKNSKKTLSSVNNKGGEKMKKRVLKDYVSFTIFYINIMLIFFNIMLLAELNQCYLFYSISLNIILVNHYILSNKTSKTFKTKLYNTLLDEE